MYFCIHKSILPPLRSGQALGTRACLNVSKDTGNDQEEKEELLTHPIIFRVTGTTFKKLEKIQQESNCQSVGEVARKIISGEKILCFYKDVTLNAPMEELTSIRKELKAIGININQQTRFFHISDSEAQRAFYVLKTADLYKKVDAKVEILLVLISKLTERWLQKS
jgi:hypothetical protein